MERPHRRQPDLVAVVDYIESGLDLLVHGRSHGFLDLTVGHITAGGV
jgi:hypothetical protein